MKKNILHVVNIFFVIPYFLGEQLRYFKSKGYKEHIACSPSSELSGYAQKMEFDFIEAPICRSISLIKDVKAIFQIANYIKKRNIDIVTGHTPKGAIIAMSAAWIKRVPKRIYFRHGLVFETSHGLKRWLLVSIDKIASALATDIVNVSPSVMEKSIDNKLGSKRKNIILGNGTCNGIDLDRFCRKNVDIERVNALKTKYEINDDDFVIGFTGRLVRDKGIIELIEAFRILHSQYPNTKLLLVGMLEERDALPQTVVDEIRNNKDIIDTGYVSYADINLYYAMMNVFVLPSYREGFPTSVLEASSMEIPVLTTRETGCVDSIVDGETGMFIDHNADSIYNAIKYLMSNPDICRSLGNAGQIMVKTKFDQEYIWKEIEEKLYDNN